ncbi:unnamed protein product [[Candida] boidinii]|uniref:Unnamed protein product n=1 Tax=Candida boidinii TaxID=5477 RepID=A0ACB5U0R5_CANBO|nr:unnamed protein product [[Candida] boidinii]
MFSSNMKIKREFDTADLSLSSDKDNINNILHSWDMASPPSVNSITANSMTPSDSLLSINSNIQENNINGIHNNLHNSHYLSNNNSINSTNNNTNGNNGHDFSYFTARQVGMDPIQNFRSVTPQSATRRRIGEISVPVDEYVAPLNAMNNNLNNFMSSFNGNNPEDPNNNDNNTTTIDNINDNNNSENINTGNFTTNTANTINNSNSNINASTNDISSMIANPASSTNINNDIMNQFPSNSQNSNNLNNNNKNRDISISNSDLKNNNNNNIHGSVGTPFEQSGYGDVPFPFSGGGLLDILSNDDPQEMYKLKNGSSASLSTNSSYYSANDHTMEGGLFPLFPLIGPNYSTNGNTNSNNNNNNNTSGNHHGNNMNMNTSNGHAHSSSFHSSTSSNNGHQYQQFIHQPSSHQLHNHQMDNTSTSFNGINNTPEKLQRNNTGNSSKLSYKNLNYHNNKSSNNTNNNSNNNNSGFLPKHYTGGSIHSIHSTHSQSQSNTHHNAHHGHGSHNNHFSPYPAPRRSNSFLSISSSNTLSSSLAGGNSPPQRPQLLTMNSTDSINGFQLQNSKTNTTLMDDLYQIKTYTDNLKSKLENVDEMEGSSNNNINNNNIDQMDINISNMNINPNITNNNNNINNNNINNNNGGNNKNRFINSGTPDSVI